jgi:PST family polysaccharide transporter/lipopolysaccharide exporter
MGIALLVLSSLKNFTQLGLDAALIQSEKDDVDDELDTAWTIETTRGLLIGSALFLAAPLIASAFGEPAATGVIRLIAVSPVAVGLRNPAVVYFRKSLEFHKEFVYRVSGSATYFAVGVGYALFEPTVYALAAGYLAADFMKLAVSYLADGYRPWPASKTEVAWERLNYGKWITANAILIFLYSQGDDAFVGWALVASSLGFYQLAYRLSNAPATEITHTVSKVTFSAYSKVQNEVDKLREGYFRTLQLTTFMSFPAAVGIAAVAPTFVAAFFDPNWQPMVQVMQLLAFYGLLRSLGSTFGPVWKATGRPDYIAKLSALRVSLIAIGIYPMTMAFGIEGTAALILGIYVFPMLPLDVYLMSRTIETSSLRIYREVSYSFLASVGMGVTVVAVQRALEFGPPVLQLALLIGVGIVAYAVLTALFVIGFDWGIKQNLVSMTESIR